MISLCSEITDAKGRRARAGWLFFDGDCRFCTSLAQRLRPVLQPRGFELAELQDPRVRDLLRLPDEELLREVLLLLLDGTLLGGAGAILYLARKIWWAWPLAALSYLPGVRILARAVYRWVASHRHCLAGNTGGGKTCAMRR